MRESVPSEREVLDRIRLEIDRHLHEHKAPEDVREFLVQHWARLMTGIFMAKGNQDPDWIAGWDTVNLLLWSLSPKTGRQETEQMLRALAGILARLHEGCAALGLPLTDQDDFFSRLALLHAAVARDGLKFRDRHEAEGTVASPAPQDPGRPDSVPTEQAAGATAPWPELRPGVRVRFSSASEERTLVLNWVSPVGGMYMFANEQGLDALTLTRARLQDRFQAGTAHLA
jgi:hypothetical protein